VFGLAAGVRAERSDADGVMLVNILMSEEMKIDEDI
jgi:hypothetical protein